MAGMEMTRRAKQRRLLLISFSAVTLLILLFLLPGPHKRIIDSKILHSDKSKSDKDADKPIPTPKYKPVPDPSPPVEENFPLAAAARSSSDLPPIPSWNKPPSPHVAENTPLFIGFTRNWLLLQQTVVSYITAGWPPEDIYVVENTGTMNANKNGQLTLQNPFYINYQRLTKVFGVNVLTTPTLLTFAQLQNYYLHYAIEKDWERYFWGHMDVAALTNEGWRDPESGEFKSLYLRCVDDMRWTLTTATEPDAKGRNAGWGIRFYAYDRLALVNRTAFEHVGGWDTMVPFYGTDCDMHTRLTMNGFKQNDSHVGLVFDIGSSLKDLARLYRRTPNPPPAAGPDNPKRSTVDVSTELTAFRTAPQDEQGNKNYISLRDDLNSMQSRKNSRDRNLWQAAQEGGQGEPYYRNGRGFERAIQMWQEFGKNLMAEKWGHRGCDLIKGAGLKDGDQWRVEKDFKG